MPDIRLPNGMIIRNVPEGITKSQLMERLGKFGIDIAAPQPSGVGFRGTPTDTAQAMPHAIRAPVDIPRQPGALATAGRAGLEEFGNNALTAAQGLVNKATPDFVHHAVQMARGQTEPMDISQGYQPREELLNFRVDDFAPNLVTDEMREQRPGAVLAGEVGGDVATLLAMRPGMRGAGNQLTGRLAAMVRPNPNLPPGAQKLLNDAAQKIVATHIPRGLGRAAEAGLEGTILAILDRQDPAMVAGLAAGSQVVSSLVLSMAKPMVTSRKGLLSSVAIGAVGLQLLKEATPGGRDRFLESLESSIFKVLPAVALGALSAGAGFGRMPKAMQDNLPILADTIATIPRGSLISLMQELTDAEDRGDPTVARVVDQYTQDPEYFGPTATRRLQRAMSVESVRIGDTIDGLMDDRQFRERFDAMN